MRAHVVCTAFTTDRILPRMARALGELEGVTVGERPDPKADLNYFLPYLEMNRCRGWRETKTAAYFTHYEPGNAKAKLWEHVAGAVDLRIVTAAQYGKMLEPFGPTVQVRPPVDLDRFKPGKRDPNAVPIIGVSGWVYPGGRKGEQLVAAAVKSDAGKAWEWRAAGQGWPVPSRLYPWDKIPAFYRSLDVYLCTATIEGVPMPPLEAMACGIRCVLPMGVGLVDELPDLPDLYRYKAGDLNSMMAALERATNESRPVDQKALREAASYFAPEHWKSEHAAAFSALLAPGKPVERQPDRHGYVVPDFGTTVPTGPSILPTLVHTDAGDVGLQRPDLRTDQGIYVVAYGEPARACATRLLRSIRQHMPNTPVMLVGDQPLNEGEAHFLETPRGDIGARSVKVRIDELAPATWERVLYLDADTELIAPVPFLFDIVKEWDFAICKNPQRFHAAQHMVRPDNGDECRETFKQWGTDQMMQWNGGVFSFQRNKRTDAFFRAWHQEWLRYGKRDQAALLRALWAHPLKLYPLGNEWNLVPVYDPISRSAGIVHHVTEAREWGKGIIPQRGDSPEAFAAVARNRRNAAAGIVTSQRVGRIALTSGGPLVKLEIKPGQFIRVTEKEAERLRRIQEEKARPQGPNKEREPATVRAK